MPEKCPLFPGQRSDKDPERHVASFGRNKTEMPIKISLTRCINQEIVVTAGAPCWDVASLKLVVIPEPTLSSKPIL